MKFVDWMDLRVDEVQGKVMYGLELGHHKSWIVR